MRRQISLLLILTLVAITSFAMDFGLRFKSHSHPLEKRTSLTLGDSNIPFKNEIKVGFHFNFYMQPMFGNIVTMVTDDGNTVSVVASHQGDNKYMLGLVVNERIKLLKGYIALTPGKEDHIDLSLNKKYNNVLFRFNNQEIELPLNLNKTSSAFTFFGVNNNRNVTDVAPIEVRNIRLFIDNVNTNFWDLKYHDAPNFKIDEIGGMKALVSNPHWLIDDHTDWHLIYKETVKGNRQTTFDPNTESFYIVDDNKVKVWRPLTHDSIEYNVTGGFRPMAFSNHILFDTAKGELVNYNLTRRTTARMNPASGVWVNSNIGAPNEEANYANHAFAINGSTAYAFGGYGFYKFHNDLFKIDLNTGAIEEIKLIPEMMPVTAAAACVVGDKLYIFGGKGNASGRQELPSKCHYALYVYDTKTWKGKLVWKIESQKYEYLPSQTMYYDPLDDCFYAASTCHGGEMIKISKSRPEITSISTHINSKMEYHDIVFDLFRSNDGRRYYLLIDKRLDPQTHDYAIYSISAPFLEDPQIIKNKSMITTEERNNNSLMWWIIGIAIGLAVIAAIWIIMRRKAKKVAAVHPDKDSEAIVAPSPDPYPSDDDDDAGDSTGNIHSEESEIEADAEHIDEALLFFDKRSDYTADSKFNRTKSAISLLGAFNVRDKNGEDITTKFTDRLKSLLILLLLANSKNKNGIKYQTIDEEIWGDKDEKSAQNNRNVYMRKLRLLLEEVGDISITYAKGYFKIECNNVMYDYGEAISRIDEIQANGNASTEVINETLDLMLMGPLLPMTTYEWLDQYKADYSDRALEILNKLLKYEFSRNYELSFKIAQTIACHEPLSEDAMKAKCILLNRKKMVGQAKKVYTKFCKEYALSLGEEYPLSFPDVCKSKI